MPEEQEQQEQAEEVVQEAPVADESAVSSPADEQSDPSSEQQAQERKPEPGDVPFNQHPRWQEVQREREVLRQQNQQLVEILQRQVQAQSAPIQQPTQADPWDGLVNHADPSTAQFYQNMQRVVRAERQAAKEEAVRELQPVIQAGMERIAQIDLRDFRKDNPEIKPGSENERLVVSYMEGRMDGFRHPIESAKRNALFDQLKKENDQLKSKQRVIPQKRAANTESSSGIPQRSGLPDKKGSWKDRAGAMIDQGADFKSVASSIFR